MKAGSKKQQEPRLVGSIIGEMLQGWNRSTELCVDLKTILHSDSVMTTGKEYRGILRRDSDAEIEEFRCHDPHYTFVETTHTCLLASTSLSLAGTTVASDRTSNR